MNNQRGMSAMQGLLPLDVRIRALEDEIDGYKAYLRDVATEERKSLMDLIRSCRENLTELLKEKNSHRAGAVCLLKSDVEYCCLSLICGFIALLNLVMTAMSDSIPHWANISHIFFSQKNQLLPSHPLLIWILTSGRTCLLRLAQS